MNFNKLSKWVLLTLGLILVISLFAPVGEQVQAATVKLNKTSVNLGIGDTFQLKVTGNKSKVTWYSQNNQGATVNSKGLVTAKKTGYTEIIAKVDGKEFKCGISVYKPSFKRSYVSIGLDEQIDLVINYLPQKYKDTEIHWETANNKIATVDSDGKVTGNSVGITKVMASFGKYTIIGKIDVNPSKRNIKDAVNGLNIQYGEVQNQIICVLTNNSKLDMTFGYDLAFYDSNNNLVSISGITGIRDGFFIGDSKILYFEKPQKGYSYYKLRFNDVWGVYNYLNQKDKVDIMATEPYEFIHNYTDFSSGQAISNSEKLNLVDLNINNRSQSRVILDACIVYYKNNVIVNIVDFGKFNGNIDLGSTILKNPLTTGYINNNLSIPEYDNYKILYSARTIKY